MFATLTPRRRWCVDRERAAAGLRVGLCVVLAFAACSEPAGGPAAPSDVVDDRPSPSAAWLQGAPLFDLERVVDVRLEIDPADWETLRHQSRDVSHVLGEAGEGCLDEPFPEAFSWFSADAVIDGVPLTRVAVRKKGFGTLDSVRPALKLKLDKYVAGQTLYGLERMTLNNTKQDPSRVSQCLSYAVYRAAGVPAPRCGYVHLSVNGADLGIYVHVESIKKPFLRREFGFDEGNLYEGASSDFRGDWVTTFEKKTHADDPDRSDLDLVVAAAAAPDDALLEDLSAVVDLEGLYTSWAVDVLIGNEDGYASNRNNFYVYRDRDGRFSFIPWGVDSVMARTGSTAEHAAVMAEGELCRRLLVHPDGRAAFFGRLVELLGGVWNEPELLAELDRQAALVAPWVLPEEQAGWQAALAAKREFIEGRRGRLETSMAADPEWDDRPEGIPCLRDRGEVDLSFSGVWGSLDEEHPVGDGSGSAALNGQQWSLAGVKARAGWDPSDPGRARIVISGTASRPGASHRAIHASVGVDASAFVAGAEVRVDLWTAADGTVSLSSGEEHEDHDEHQSHEGDESAENHEDHENNENHFGIMLFGTLTLEQVSTEPGEWIVGYLTSRVVESYHQ